MSSGRVWPLTGNRETDLKRTQEWIEESVLIFGGSRITAVTVSETFADGVRREWAKSVAEGNQ